MATTTIFQTPFNYIKGANEFGVVGISSIVWKEDPNVNVGEFTNKIEAVLNPGQTITLVQYDFVYYTRSDPTKPWVLNNDNTTRLSAALEIINNVGMLDRRYKRVRGRSGLNFMWMHKTTTFHLVDPSPTNINDAFVIQKGYYIDMQNWLSGIGSKPVPPTPIQLRNDYKDLLVNAMISDAVIFHPGKIKLIIGDKSIPQLQAQLLVVKNGNSNLTDSQIKVKVRNTTRAFFDITKWEFGETFYFTELATAIHQDLAADINSVVLVPLYPDHFFGDGFQVNMAEDEIVQADIDNEDIIITNSLNAVNMNQFR